MPWRVPYRLTQQRKLPGRASFRTPALQEAQVSIRSRGNVYKNKWVQTKKRYSFSLNGSFVERYAHRIGTMRIEHVYACAHGRGSHFSIFIWIKSLFSGEYIYVVLSFLLDHGRSCDHFKKRTNFERKL
ncbi:hypothetical protein CEXT_346931 [Caerostris extrusa]|uniref:Uncharacterized protein n=1 Tax=Caerostris extrusa TaxID=172846 RepID=A0AAV4V771_CAEEX|nr:hypothetical protein CEXT_346931 [Caerostris extrusa]